MCLVFGVCCLVVCYLYLGWVALAFDLVLLCDLLILAGCVDLRGNLCVLCFGGLLV